MGYLIEDSVEFLFMNVQYIYAHKTSTSISLNSFDED